MVLFGTLCVCGGALRQVRGEMPHVLCLCVVEWVRVLLRGVEAWCSNPARSPFFSPYVYCYASKS